MFSCQRKSIISWPISTRKVREHCRSAHGQRTKIHTVLDKNAVYSPTDNQSYQHTDRRKKTCSTRQKHCMLSDRQPKLSTRGQKTKIHAVLDKDTVYSPTDNQSYQRADRRQKYMQYKTKTLYILRQTTKVTNTRTEDKNTCSTRRKYFILSDRPHGPKAVLDENTLYSPTDNQSFL